MVGEAVEVGEVGEVGDVEDEAAEAEAEAEEEDKAREAVEDKARETVRGEREREELGLEAWWKWKAKLLIRAARGSSSMSQVEAPAT